MHRLNKQTYFKIKCFSLSSILSKFFKYQTPKIIIMLIQNSANLIQISIKSQDLGIDWHQNLEVYTYIYTYFLKIVSTNKKKKSAFPISNRVDPLTLLVPFQFLTIWALPAFWLATWSSMSLNQPIKTALSYQFVFKDAFILTVPMIGSIYCGILFLTNSLVVCKGQHK